MSAFWQKYDTQALLDETLICRGNISMGVSATTLGKEKNIAVCSLEGDIIINSSHLQGKGILYAPEDGTDICVLTGTNFEEEKGKTGLDAADIRTIQQKTEEGKIVLAPCRE